MMVYTLKMKKAVSVTAILLMTSIALPASAHGVVSNEHHQQSMHKGSMAKHAMKRMKKHLALTDEQIVSIKSIKAESKVVVEPLREQAKNFYQSAKQLKDNKMFDEGAFTSLYAQYQDTFAQIALQKAKTKHAIYQVLTEEQQQKWDEAKEKRKGKRGNKGRF